MSRSKTLERLLRIRELEEEQKRLRLDAAMANLETLEKNRNAAVDMELHGRTLVGASVISGEITDRQAGLVETEAARALGSILEPRIAASQREVVERRQEFMDKRVERRQAETLVEQFDAREESNADRRVQRNIDDWYGARLHRQLGDDQDR